MTTPTVEEIVTIARRNIVPKNLQHIPLSDDEWMKGKSKVECVNEVYQWVIDMLTPLTTYGNARYEEGVKAERERVREFINDRKHTAFLLGNKNGTYDKMACYYRTESFKLIEDFLSDNK